MNFFDLHADTPLYWSHSDSGKTAVDLAHHPFDKYTQTLAVFLRESEKNAFEVYCNRVRLIRKVCETNDITLFGQNQVPYQGAILSVENADFLAEDTKRVERLFLDSVRMVGLTWNNDNHLAGGSLSNNGLTSLGIKVIERLNEFRMVLDISHLSNKSAEQAVELANFVVASHSCANAVYSHKRNISESVLLRLRDKKGLIGLCFYPQFLGSENVIDALYEQISYLCSLDMEDNIAIGSDFDGAKMAPVLSKTADIPSLYNALFCKGIKKSLLDAIFYENALAFFGKMCENI